MSSSAVLTGPQAQQSYGLRAWVVCLTAALFFFYEFIQMNFFNSISSQLMTVFHVQATDLGTLSAFYFVANVFFLFPAGAILDRYSTRRVILISLGVCIAGTVLFSSVYSYGWALLFRFLTGIGGAFCFLSCVRLVSRWFQAKRIALAMGIVVTMAMLGGWVAQTPLTELVGYVNWRHALLIDAGFGLLVWLLIAAFVKDYPPGTEAQYQAHMLHLRSQTYLKSAKLAFARVSNWLAGAYTGLMNLPLSLLGGLWGAMYLVEARHFSQIEASEISGMIFIGTVVGSPLIGFISDQLTRRRLPMIVGALLSLVVMVWIIYLPHVGFWEMMIAFFILGLVTSSQIISYAYVAEHNSPMITAMAVSAVSIITMGSQGLLQPFFGLLMDLHAHAVHHGTHIYTAGDFKWALLIFPVGFILALMAVVSLREDKTAS